MPRIALAPVSNTTTPVLTTLSPFVYPSSVHIFAISKLNVPIESIDPAIPKALTTLRLGQGILPFWLGDKPIIASLLSPKELPKAKFPTADRMSSVDGI